MTDTLYGIWGSTLTGIANAIRTKNPDVTGEVDPADMRQDILDISGGGGEPYIPMKQLISEFDFKSSAPYYDIVKETNLSTNMRGLSYTQDIGIMPTVRGTRLRTGTIFDYAGIYEIEVKFGTFDRTTALTNGNNVIIKVGRNSAALMLNYYYNSSQQTGRWWIHDQSGNNIYFDYGENNPYYLENKTLTMTYGAKYVNGKLVRDASKGYFYIDGVQQHQNGAGLTGDTDNGTPIVFLCDSGNNAFIGAVYESLKIWEYRYNLDDTDDIIQPITITANGTYTADGNTVAGYSPITVAVPEPTTKVVSEFDFSEAEYDLIRSMPNDDPSLNALLQGYTYNASYDDVNDEISWVNGYGCWSPNLWCDPFKNYDIEVDLGTFDSTTQLAGTKQVIALIKDGTNGLRLVWNTRNGYFQIINDSGTTNLTNYNDLSILNNAKMLIKTRWSISTINYAPVCNATIILDRDNSQSEEISFGRLDKDYAYELRVGRVTSQNGIYPYSVKKCKITESKWILESPVSLMSASPSEEETE